ncbi:MAG TPA: DoxX family protein [Bacteroidia bacterium]|jgi:hypothetical protein|nr:DoxX family protein [Bacteroidia bacterium]
MFKKILLSILCALLGGVFIFSAIAKLYPIEPFEYTFVDLGIGNWQFAPFIARLIIAVEFLIGLLLVLNIQLRRITCKLGITAILIFCVYLLLQLIISGNKGNCGCFGTTLYMTPSEALLKNISLLFVFVGLYKFHNGWDFGRASSYIFAATVLVSFGLPFILNPVQLDYSEAYLSKSENRYTLRLDTLFNNALLSKPPKELSKGKKIIAFMSLTCPHCKIAAQKIHVMNKRNSAIPFYFVLNGKEEDLKRFFDDTKTGNINYCLLKGSHFVYLAGINLPSIYLINNSVVENQVNYITLDEKEIEKWLGEGSIDKRLNCVTEKKFVSGIKRGKMSPRAKL